MVLSLFYLGLGVLLHHSMQGIDKTLKLKLYFHPNAVAHQTLHPFAAAAPAPTIMSPLVKKFSFVYKHFITAYTLNLCFKPCVCEHLTGSGKFQEISLRSCSEMRSSGKATAANCELTARD